MTAYVDRVDLTPLAPSDAFWRVYWTAYGPLAPHPEPTMRFSLVKDSPPGTIVRSGIYLSNRPDGAIWETLLRDLYPKNGVITLRPGLLDRRQLVQLRLKTPRNTVWLQEPHRRRLFLPHRSAGDVSRSNFILDQLLSTDTHFVTQYAASAIDAMVANDPHLFPGLTWRSKQDNASLVHLLYAPPYAPGDLEVVGAPIDLTTPAGCDYIRRAVEAAGMTLFDPSSVDFDDDFMVL